jgi:hypothetical protein
LGGSAGQASPVTQGYTALFTLKDAGDLFLRLAQYERGKSGGGKGRRQQLKLDDEIIVRAKLIGINDDAITKSIQGSTTVPLMKSLAKLTVEHIKKKISITVKRILS